MSLSAQSFSRFGGPALHLSMESTNNNSAMILPYFASMDMGGTLSSPRSMLTCNSNSGLYYPSAGGAAVASPLEAPPPVHRERGPVMSLFPSDDASNYGSRSRVSSGNNSNGAAHPPPPSRPFFGQLQLKCHRSRALTTLCVSPSHGEQEVSSMARLEEDTVQEALPVCPSPTNSAANNTALGIPHTTFKKGTPPPLPRCVVEVPVSPSIPHLAVPPPPLLAIAMSDGDGDQMAAAKDGEEEEEEILVVVCPSATHRHLVAVHDGLAGSTSVQAEPHSHVLCSVEQHAPNPEGNEANLSPVLQQQEEEEEKGVATNLGSNCRATPTSVLGGTPQRGTIPLQQEGEGKEEEADRGVAVDLYGSLIVGESSAVGGESCRRREGSLYPTSTATIGPKNAMSSWRTPAVPLATAEPPMAGSFDGVLPEGGEATPTLSELHHSTREGDSPAITHELSGCSPMVHSITQPFSSSGSVSDVTFGSGSSRPFGRKVFSSGTPRSGGTMNEGLLLVPHRPPQSIVSATFTSASLSSQRSAALLRGGSLAALREHPTTSSSSSSPVTATAMLSETNHSVVTKPLSAVPSLSDEVMQQQQQQSLFDRQHQTNPLCEEEEEGTFTAASPTSPAAGAAAAATLRFPGRSGFFLPRKGSFTTSNARVPLHEYQTSSPHDLVCLIQPTAEEDHLPLCPLNSRDTTVTTSSTVSYRSTTLKPDTLLCHPQPPPWAFPASCSPPAAAREQQRVGKAQSLTCSPPRSQKFDGSQHFNRSLTVVATTTKHSVPATEALPFAPTTYLMPLCVPTPSREIHHTGGESHDDANDQMSFSMDYVDGALRSTTTTTTTEHQPKDERDDHHHYHNQNKKKEILTAHSSFVSHGDVPPTTLPTIAQWRCPTLPLHAAPGAGGLAAQSITTSSGSSSCTAVLTGRSFASLKVSMTQTQLELAMALMSVCGAPIAQ